MFFKRADEFGVPSPSFVMETASHLISSSSSSRLISEAAISLQNSSLSFRPRSYDLRRKKELVQSLKDGSKHYVNLQEVPSFYPEASGDSEKATSLLKVDSGNDVFFTINYGVSATWFGMWISELTKEIISTGCAKLDVSLVFQETI
jgi:hypothetical protein